MKFREIQATEQTQIAIEHARLEAEKLQIEKDKLRLQLETYESPASIFKRYGLSLIHI